MRTARGFLATIVAIGALVVTATATGAQASYTGPDRIARPDRPVAEQYIVTLRELPSVVPGDADVLTRLHGGRLLQRFQTAFRGFTVRMTEAQAQALARDPRVAAIEQDGYVTADSTQTPTPSWGLDRVDQRSLPLNSSYTYNTTGAGVHAYIIDSGIRTAAAEFGGRATVGRDTINDGQNGQDCNGHGTHVAGTVGGNLYGIAKNVQLVAVRVLNCSGSGTWSQVIVGIDWVTQNAIKPAVANMSLSGGVSSAVNNAVRELDQLGRHLRGGRGEQQRERMQLLTVVGGERTHRRRDDLDRRACLLLELRHVRRSVRSRLVDHVGGDKRLDPGRAQWHLDGLAPRGGNGCALPRGEPGCDARHRGERAEDERDAQPCREPRHRLAQSPAVRRLHRRHA